MRRAAAILAAAACLTAAAPAQARTYPIGCWIINQVDIDPDTLQIVAERSYKGRCRYHSRAQRRGLVGPG